MEVKFDGVALDDADGGGYVVPVTFELLADIGKASPLQLAWLKEREAERAARWRALPRHVRFAELHIWPRWHEARWRLAHAVRALRGIECERDDY